ncbi:neuronal acetylcholine receptor subunit alpha-6-like [Mytilus californianus]|uniref:neuronal acetylcholine receptor subunit alpha-6-like n=1 Tax=Mytilus californianus TaxID=6549 RepID=UPI0022459898|nr:neuronal acetylcholine receptor subunit alpha-6-like [Mytilus californianus]
MTILTVNNLVWDDKRLDWTNPSTTTLNYSSVNYLFSNEVYVWRPAIVIENSVRNLGVISDTSIPMRIVKNGQVVWNPSGVFEVSCDSDTRFYPIDTQECTIKVSSWAYTSTEVELFVESDPVDFSFYSENGEWSLISSSGNKISDSSRGGSSFSSVSFSIKLQRRPMFHIINTLFPVALLAVLIAMVFKLPVDSGEKNGFALTVLLSYAVYLTLISDNIPSTSVSICYLSLYLAFILTLGAISVVLTIIVLRLHFKTENTVIPKWLKTLTKTVLRKMAFMAPCRKEFKVNDIQNLSTADIISIDDVQGYKNDPIRVMKKENITSIPDTTENAESELTWQELAIIMDAVFFNIYIALITITTILLFITFTIHYNI